MSGAAICIFQMLDNLSRHLQSRMDEPSKFSQAGKCQGGKTRQDAAEPTKTRLLAQSDKTSTCPTTFANANISRYHHQLMAIPFLLTYLYIGFEETHANFSSAHPLMQVNNLDHGNTKKLAGTREAHKTRKAGYLLGISLRKMTRERT